jgi:hypothetical protein
MALFRVFNLQAGYIRPRRLDTDWIHKAGWAYCSLADCRLDTTPFGKSKSPTGLP